MTFIDYATILVFLAGVFWLGASLYRWVGSPDDFYVAGRQLTPFILAASMTTADAYDVRPALVDSHSGAGLKLVTTGLIEPGRCCWGACSTRSGGSR